MNFQEALDYLYSFINYDITRQERYNAGLMLDRPHQLMERLGNPHQAYPIIHIAGTKGKGSVGAMCAAMLQAAGYKVGLYSSPHLQDFRERFKINNELIGEDAFVKLVEEIKPDVDGVPGLIWFDVVTGLAFEYFRRAVVDITVVEVGLGGRLDSTNIVTPLVSVITSLSLDHMSWLGNTLPEIAFEKAGIIKPGIPVVSAPQPPDALAVLESVANEQHAPLTLVGRDWQFESLSGDLQIERWKAAPVGQALKDYQTILLGRHQAINATVALAAMEKVSQAGIAVSDAEMRQGLAQVNWAGRLEIVRKFPVIVLDAAHNGESAHRLKETLVERFPWQPLILVFAAKTDKDIDGMLRELLPVVDHLIVTQAVDSRAESPDRIAERVRNLGFMLPVNVIPDVPTALHTAENYAGVEGMVCVTGSLYLVGEARTVYDLKVGQSVSVYRAGQDVQA